MIKIPVQVSSDVSPLIAKEMLRSVREVMPDAHMIHVCADGDKIEGFDELMHVEFNGDFVDQRLDYMSRLEGNVLSLDYDIILCEDVSDVFDEVFDVCFTKRPEIDETVNAVFQDSYNLGVIFSKNTEFWKCVREHYLKQPMRDGWMRSQTLIYQIVQLLAGERVYHVGEIPSEQYNYTPKSRYENLDGRSIVHYKGKRKAWMLPEELRIHAEVSIQKTLEQLKNKPFGLPTAGERAKTKEKV